MHRRLAVFGFLAVVVLLSAGIWWLGYRTAILQVADRGAADLRSASNRLVGQLARYRLVAVMLADHPDVERLAAGTGDPARTARLFLRVADQTGALEIAYLGPGARRLSSSRQDAPAAPMDPAAHARALNGALGFGHGRAPGTGTRAFTFMAPVFDGARPAGALAVRVDMETVEESDWRGAAHVLFYTDDAARIFIANRSELLSRRLGGTGDDAFRPAQRTRTGGVPVWTVRDSRYVPGRAVYRELPLPVIGMTGHALVSTRPAERAATMQAAMAAAICLAFGAFLFLATERRRALAQEGLDALVIAGGVSANTNLRESLERALAPEGARVYYPAPVFCTDNGAMIAYAGAQRLLAGERDGPDVRVRPRWPMEELPPLAGAA